MTAKKSKEMAGDYEIQMASKLGGKTMLVGYDPHNTEQPYMTCFREVNFLGDAVFTEAIGSDDYLTVIKLFTERLQAQIEKTEQFRSERNVPFVTLGREHCRKREDEESLAGKLIVLSPFSLAPEYRTADCQLGFATGGFGCNPGAGGRAVYFRELYSGEECRWDVGDVLGIADPDKLPGWAKDRLAAYENRRTAPKKEREETR